GDVVGSAFVCTDEVVAQRLPSVASVFTAELHAIHLALQHIQSKPHHHAVVYVDSLSALQALCSAVCWEHPMVCATRRLLRLLSSSGFLVQFCWVPGHVGIRGNDLADVAAKSVSSLGVTRHPLFFRDFYSIICSFIRQTWQTVWDAQVHNKLHQLKPSLGLWQSSLRSNRRQEVVLARLRIGHCRLTHRYLLCGEEAPVCALCNTSLTVHHLLFLCPCFSPVRMFYYNHPVLPDNSVSLNCVLGDRACL
ncbi:RNAse HI domain-containing protein, partial [Salmonella enterica subsp. enterica serovar Hadar]|nr:RNAse HI domain-containing protein [Salmonella enterica subsp. enterica serovar Hadar]